MRYFQLFVNSTLLLTTPSLLVYPQSNQSRVVIEESEHQNAETPLYEKIVLLLEQVESGEWEKKCTPEELKKLQYFIAFLAKKGVLPDNSEESLSLDNDIDALLNERDNLDEYVFSSNNAYEYQYMIAPSLLNDQYEIVLCKSWLSKQCRNVRHFVKKHKKGLLLGAGVAAATVTVIGLIVVASSAAAGTAIASAAGVAGAAASSHSDKKDKNEAPLISSILEDITPLMIASQEAPGLTSAIDYQASIYKDQIVKGGFFPPQSQDSYHQQLPIHESTRALGSLFTHDSFNNLQNQIASHPGLAQEARHLESKYHFSAQNHSVGHSEIDRNFSTDYSHLYANPSQEVNFNALSHQVRGETAMAYGYYNQAVQDFGKAIETNPSNPIPYLERGVAHFGLGQYDRSIEDYRLFTDQAQKANPLSVPEFSLGFAKGLPHGIYESGRGMVLFLRDVAVHPIQTGQQMWEALTLLTDLGRSGEWGALGEVLAPEVHQLVKEWDTTSADRRGEIAGYIFGKYGADILVPGAIAKMSAKGLKGVQELNTVCKGLKIAEQTFLLESAAALENSAKIAEVVQLEKNISEWLGEGAQLLRNKAEDPIFLSKDGLRKVRFDFNKPAPHKSPHMHFEHFVDGTWQELSRVYPIDVPHQ